MPSTGMNFFRFSQSAEFMGCRLGVGHHGSHPHLCDEFIRSILEERKPEVDEALGANITLAGILAHESAMNSGIAIEVPEF